MIKKIVATLIVVLFSFCAFTQTDTFTTTITKVEEFDNHSTDYEWKLTSELGTRLELICPPNKKNTAETSHIKFFGTQGQYITDFKIQSNISCNELMIFLRATSFKIDHNLPIIIEFSRLNRFVKSISLPKIDIYEQSNRDNTRPH